MRKPIDVVFSFDTTGSMYPCLAEVRRKLSATITRLFRDIPDLKIGVIAHGDYCDGDRVITVRQPTNNVDELVRFVETVRPTDGGDLPEAYELVLRTALRSIDFRPSAENLLVVIGDDVPHTASYYDNKLRINWIDEAKALADNGVTIYAVQALGRNYATTFYNELAKHGNGYKINLDQFSNIAETILAICYRQSGDEHLQSYQKELEFDGKMNRSLANLFETLSGKKVAVTKTGLELDAVPPSRFQVLSVDERISIQDFVNGTGAKFQKGKGFYQFTKTEDIQSYKEVVLVDKRTGDMFSGDKARELIGLPRFENARLSPRDCTGARAVYDVFIQSTSNNRVLMPNTKFLYEVE